MCVLSLSVDLQSHSLLVKQEPDDLIDDMHPMEAPDFDCSDSAPAEAMKMEESAESVHKSGGFAPTTKEEKDKTLKAISEQVLFLSLHVCTVKRW